MFARLAAVAASVALLFLTPRAHAEVAAPSDSGLRKLALSNGLEVFIGADHHVPRAEVLVRYRVGRRDDPVNRPGMAEAFEILLEHVSTRHVRDFSSGDALFVAGAPNGIPTNVMATDDETYVGMHVGANATELALFLAADRLGFLTDGIGPEMVEYVREQVEHVTTNPDNSLLVKVVHVMEREAFGSGHPYGRLGSDLTPKLNGLTVREVAERYQAAYGPGNATLVVLGDIDPVRVEDQVRRYFEPLLRTPRLPAHSRENVTLAAEKKIVFEANVANPQMFLGWPTAPFYSADDIALDVVARILRERLHQKLTIERKVTTLTGARQASRELGSFFYVTAAAAPGHELAEVQQMVEEQIRELSANVPTARETSSFSNEFATNLSLGHVAIKDRAHHFASTYQAIGDLTFYDRYIAGYLSLTPSQVQQAVARYLHPAHRIVATIVPNKNAPAVGRVMGEKAP